MDHVTMDCMVSGRNAEIVSVSSTPLVSLGSLCDREMAGICVVPLSILGSVPGLSPLAPGGGCMAGGAAIDWAAGATPGSSASASTSHTKRPCTRVPLTRCTTRRVWRRSKNSFS